VIEISAGLWCTCIINEKQELWYFGTICWEGEPWKGIQKRISSPLPKRISVEGKVVKVSSKSKQVCFEVLRDGCSYIYEIGKNWPPKMTKEDVNVDLLKSTHMGIFYIEK